MMKKNITKIIKKNLKLKSEPKILYSKQRRHSLIYDFVGDNKRFILKVHQKEKEINNLKQYRETIQKRALAEWESLNYFYNLEKKNNRPVSFIKPVIYVQGIGGIITEKVEGKDFHEIIKKSYFKKQKIRNEENIKKIGKELAFIHNQTKKRKEEMEFKLEDVNNKKLDQKIKNIFKKENKHYSFTTDNITMLDIRNIIISKKEEIFFLDPTRKTKFICERLAYFLINMKILYLGTLFFPLRKIDKKYEKAFLNGYFQDKPYNKKLLGLCILARLTKEYNRSIKKINDRAFNNVFLKNILIRLYINKFYYREIRGIIKEYEL